MVAYLDDWLIFSLQPIPVAALGLTINQHKSILQPVEALIYLGLHTDTRRMMITPSRPSISGTTSFTTGPRAHRGLHCLDIVLYGLAAIPRHPGV